jgi:hypothetical protein
VRGIWKEIFETENCWISEGRVKSPLVMVVSEEQELSSDWRVSGAITLSRGFQRGAIAFLIDGRRESRSLPRVIQNRDTVLLALERGRSPERAKAGGMQRGARSGPPCQDALHYSAHLASASADKDAIEVQCPSIPSAMSG